MIWWENPLFSETSVYKCMGPGTSPGAASHGHCCLSDCFVHLQRITGQLAGAWKTVKKTHSPLENWGHMYIYIFLSTCDTHIFNTHTYIHTNVYIYIYSIYTCYTIHTSMCVYIDAYIDAYIHACMHACIHTYIPRNGGLEDVLPYPTKVNIPQI